MASFFGEEGDECPICHEPMVTLTHFGTERNRAVCCGNFFCPMCAERMQEYQRRATTPQELLQSLKCPLCRQQLPSTPEESFQLTMKKAQEGHAWAQYSIGTKFESGNGTAENVQEAAHWFKLSAEQGHPWGMSSYGTLLLNQGQREGKRWVEKSVECGFVKAQYNLGQYYLEGKGGIIPKDPTMAIGLLQQSADRGFDMAECALGTCYDHGEGVPRDLEKAYYWHLRAANQGNATAMNNVGANLMQLAQEKYGSVEIPGKSPIPQAMKWARKAAAQGDEDAARVVSQMETASLRACAQCQTEGSDLKRCTKCKVMRYCSKDCQVSHWRAGHKKDCCRQE